MEMMEIPLNPVKATATSSWIKIKSINYMVDNRIYARSVNIIKMTEEDILNDLYNN